MEIIGCIGDWAINFIFNWTTYFWSIPIWFFGGMAIVKISEKEVTIGDLLRLIVLSLLNPLWHIIIFAFIMSSPITVPAIYLICNWDDIDSKKVF